MTMKKKILSAAVLAALGAGTAQAVNLSTDGTGQGLLFPYYTVQGTENTLLSVVNTTDNGKAVKIRFREAYNSREVLDFNIYLSPYDVWTGMIRDSATGGAEVVSNDLSCTVPISISQGTAQPFRTFGYDGQAPVAGGKDSGPQGYERTNEGYVEILEMGVALDDEDVWGEGSDGPYYLHVNGVPKDCQAIQNNFSGVWKSNKQDGIGQPEGGLFGQVAIINIQSGTEVSVAATALEDIFDGPKHADTGTLRPSLSEAANRSSVFYNPDESTGNQRPVKIDDTWLDGLDAVSAVLMAEHVMNEYTVNPNVAGETAWVVTFPTKWGYADSITGVDSGRDEPFTSEFDYGMTSDTPGAGKACEKIGVTAWDREEGEITPSDIDFSPSPETPGIELCYEANVIQFGESDVFSAMNTVLTYTALPGKNGWMRIDMYSADTDHMLGRYKGLPVIGFMSSQIGNANIGVGAAYGTSNPHVYHRSISGSSAD